MFLNITCIYIYTNIYVYIFYDCGTCLHIFNIRLGHLGTLLVHLCIYVWRACVDFERESAPPKRESAPSKGPIAIGPLLIAY